MFRVYKHSAKSKFIVVVYKFLMYIPFTYLQSLVDMVTYKGTTVVRLPYHIKLG